MLVAGCAVALALLASPSSARARDEDEGPPDARLSGFTQEVKNDGSNMVQWFTLFGMGIIGLSVLFIDAKRSHLD
jgi:hypothetical protein